MTRRLLIWLQDRQRGIVLLLAAAVLGLYLPFLANPFFFDDIGFFGTPHPLPVEPIQFLTPRWLSYGMLGVLQQAFSAALPHVFRLLNALLHLAVVLALFALLRQLLLHARVTPQSAATCAAVGALAFALHPAASYATGYAVQASILLATLLSLLALQGFLRLLQTGDKRWAALVVALYFLACFSKEHAIALPLVMAAMILTAGRDRRASWNLLLLCGAACAVVGGVLLTRMGAVIGSAYEPMSSHVLAQAEQAGASLSHLLSAMTQAGLFFRYLLLWLLPLPAWMSIDMRVFFPTGAGDWKAWAGAAAFAVYGLLAFRLLLVRGRAGLAGLGLLWPWLMFLVEFSSVRVQEPFALYRSYIWMPGLVLAVAAVLPGLGAWAAARARVIPGRPAGVAIVAVAALLIAGASVNRLQVASDPWRLWDDAVRLLPSPDVPGADRVYYNRGTAALTAGRTAEAVADLRQVVKASPGLAPAHHALGLAYLANRQLAEAHDTFARALALAPRNPGSLFAQAVVVKRLGREDEAQSLLQAACNAGHNSACLLLGLQKNGRPALAAWPS